MKLSLVSSVAAALFSTAQAADVPALEIVGNKFFYSNNGSQFYIRGVAYQSNAVVNDTSGTSFNDPLADASACKRDIPYLQQLSTNLIRVYAVNTSVDHSECMQQLNDAGIYVLSDLSEPGLSINRNSPSWNVELLNRYTAVVDALANYTNVLGFFAGNEVTNAKNNTDASPFVKAAIRDVKSYMKQKNYRSIPVGYSASDDADVRVPEADYFACGNGTEHADFYGVNMYEWCGNSTFQESGYEARTNEMKNMSIPLFFSEYGCNQVKPRKFQEVGTLYSDEMTDVWSGGIVYMYFQEQNDYGLVSVSGNSISTMADFGYLSNALKTISPSIAQSSDITTSGSVIACPTTQANWDAATKLPPTPDAGVCDCLSPAAACVVSDDVDESDYGKLFGEICGDIECAAITQNGTSGTYGAFAGCSPKQQLNYVINQYYQQNGQSSQACNFDGSASINSQTTTASQCEAVFSAVGSSGTGQLSQGTSINPGSKTNGDARAAATGSVSGSGSASSATGSGSAKSSSKSSSSKSGSSSKSKNAAPVATGNLKIAAGVLGGAMAVVAGAL